jgi:type IV pilus assembly protein PilC
MLIRFVPHTPQETYAMTMFKYTAMDAAGKEKRGTVDAESEAAAANQLKQQGLFPTSISEAQARSAGKSSKKTAGPKNRKVKSGRLSFRFGSPKMSTRSLCTFTRQLATLLDAGLPLVRGLRTLERQTTESDVAVVVGDVANSVESGMTFSEALAGHPKSFDKLYVNMVRAGEASGAMEQVLNKLAEFMEKAARLRSKIKTALVYPVVVLVIALTITTGLMIFIVPKFAKIFEEMLGGEGLPPLTQLVISISELLMHRGYIPLTVLVVMIVAYKQLKKTNAGSYFFDLVAFRTPPFSDLVVKSSVARFCSTLSTLMSSGVSVLNALIIVRDTVGNRVVSQAVQVIHDAVKEGEGMTKPLSATEAFPPMVVSMIEVGEETGALPEMMGRISKQYEEEVDNAVEAMTSLIEPAMIIFLAIVVGGIVIALFLPLIILIERMGG